MGAPYDSETHGPAKASVSFVNSELSTLDSTIATLATTTAASLASKLDKAGSNPHGDYTSTRTEAGLYTITFTNGSSNVLSNSVGGNGRYSVSLTSFWGARIQEVTVVEKSLSFFKVAIKEHDGNFIDRDFDFICFYDGKCFCQGTVAGNGSRIGYAS